MRLTLSENNIRQMARMNSFKVPNDGIVIIGFRGSIPLYEDNHEFQKEHQIILQDLNYLNPRCTIGQWIPRNNQFALFPGSTVPNIKYIKESKERNGLGANQLMTGFYSDYRRGLHKRGKPTGHSAFRQTDAHPIRRTADDFDYDNDDRVEFANSYDNIHAAWSMGIDHDYYASAGCQVILGYPQCEKRDNKPNIGPWATFKEKPESKTYRRLSQTLWLSRLCLQ